MKEFQSNFTEFKLDWINIVKMKINISDPNKTFINKIQSNLPKVE